MSIVDKDHKALIIGLVICVTNAKARAAEHPLCLEVAEERVKLERQEAGSWLECNDLLVLLESGPIAAKPIVGQVEHVEVISRLVHNEVHPLLGIEHTAGVGPADVDGANVPVRDVEDRREVDGGAHECVLEGHVDHIVDVEEVVVEILNAVLHPGTRDVQSLHLVLRNVAHDVF